MARRRLLDNSDHGDGDGRRWRTGESTVYSSKLTEEVNFEPKFTTMSRCTLLLLGVSNVRNTVSSFHAPSPHHHHYLQGIIISLVPHLPIPCPLSSAEMIAQTILHQKRGRIIGSTVTLVLHNITSRSSLKPRFGRGCCPAFE